MESLGTGAGGGKASSCLFLSLPASFCPFLSSCPFLPLSAPVPSDSIAGPFFTFSYRKAMVRPAITMLTIDISLMRMFSDGPEVSLNGSPTVSPTIVDL